ncbi:MAG: bis(5'-nucleosyl)-tetraphosphatase (symmetrical) YqeK, partial [Clostridia bacterium]|nr:bis(5'-nucleosyl)-tetraphosphatase (symmetrical) YqeK [Clostridia bacterium]
RRYAHSLNVADAAKELAERNGVDADKAYLCGLLHDIEKNRPWDEQERYMKQLGDALPDHVVRNKKLWHAPAGAAYARDELGILDADMIRAIKYHTTGRPNMSPLEKVLYVADYVSIERDYPGVERVREAAYRNLDEAILIGGRFTLISLLERYRVVNYDTFAMYNEVAAELGAAFEESASKA